MTTTVIIEPLTRDAFSPFGDVLDAAGIPDKIINQGRCQRFHNQAKLDFDDGDAGISLFKAEPRTLPLTLDLLERHPLGSQAFLPMSFDPFLVIAAPDVDGRPEEPRAFLTTSGQGVNFFKGTWHGVLTPLHAPGLFAVVDRIGTGSNLEECWLDTPYVIDEKP